jgi:diguanylate cyclase (GGDEF)-like protein/PAS domain S-box-containing protein
MKSIHQEYEKKSVDLNNIKEQLEVAYRDLDAVSFSVGHDFRNSLNHITGFLKILEQKMDGRLDEKEIHYITLIMESAKKLDDMIKAIQKNITLHRPILTLNDNNERLPVANDPEDTERSSDIGIQVDNIPLRALIIEDSAADCLLLVNLLEISGYILEHRLVDTADAMRKALEENTWDIVISDYNMPRFNGLDALKLLKKKNANIPFILVSGTMGEETAVMAMKAGASDYLMKNNLSRLPSAIKREISDSIIRIQLKESEDRYHKLVELSPDGIFIQCENKFVFANLSACKIFGVENPKQIIKKQVSDFVHASYQALFKEITHKLSENTTGVQLSEGQFIRMDGGIIDAEIVLTPFLFEGKRAIQGIIRDITERKRTESLAYQDALTGLANRPMFEGFLDQAIKLAERQKQQLAILFLDLDYFKNVNDNLGHEAGDYLLKEVAKRLVDSIRKCDIAARLGGDEFVLTITSIKDKADAEFFVKRIFQDLKKPIEINNKEFFIHASMGISLYPENGADAQTLLNNADSAMYQAKNHGKNTYQFFDK